MAIIVEDGSIVANANSYASETELTDFATDRGLVIAGTESVLLLKAMDYIESLNFQGTKSTSGQALQWPRTGVVIDTYAINSDVIPNDLKKAQMLTALSIDAGNDPSATLTQGIKRERVDVIEVEYMDGSSASPVIKSINYALWKLLASGSSGGNVIGVRKA